MTRALAQAACPHTVGFQVIPCVIENSDIAIIYIDVKIVAVFECTCRSLRSPLRAEFQNQQGNWIEWSFATAIGE